MVPVGPPPILTPLPPLPEIILRALAPPTVLLAAASEMMTPSMLLARGRLPVTSVPIRFPCTRLLLAEMRTPHNVLPEITLPDPVVRPPMVLSVDVLVTPP